jgi:hypothetical protein
VERRGQIVGATDDAADLNRRAQNLREAARQARAIAKTLGPYLDDAVRKATPRADDFVVGTGGDTAIWQGPYADQCTATLKARQSKLSSMANALVTDAARWESEATRLEGDAKTAKSNANAKAGGK